MRSSAQVAPLGTATKRRSSVPGWKRSTPAGMGVQGESSACMRVCACVDEAASTLAADPAQAPAAAEHAGGCRVALPQQAHACRVKQRPTAHAGAPPTHAGAASPRRSPRSTEASACTTAPPPPLLPGAASRSRGFTTVMGRRKRGPRHSAAASNA
jgi:hypothetical protein